MGFDLPPPPSRDQVRRTAEGIISETVERQASRTATILIDGTIYFGAIGLLAGDIITGAAIQVAVAGGTLALSKLGLYDKAGNRLAITADQGAAWQSAGVKNPSFISPYTVPATDGYYLAVIAKVSAGALPTLLNGSAWTTMSSGVGSGMIPSGVQTAQTDLVNPATISSAASGLNLWLSCF